ncbi:hypothetical protein ECZU23_43010 [Escherichia coli]|nr:hypothetical protein ECZU11_26040 [Escherichia coli]GHK96588.1 hypothetical protein ECZU20_13380 [Escherichia coli]GHL15858.1 hypothetical protein ECZU23_43010 [Escherichia coli]
MYSVMLFVPVDSGNIHNKPQISAAPDNDEKYDKPAQLLPA